MTETIFMIHGMWGGSWYWGNYKSFFENENYRCVTTTLRFHDMDPKVAPDPQLGKTSLLDYAEDLEQEIRQLGVKPIVMGHSMGGLLAQILGSRGLAKALVLLMPASPAGIMALKPSVIKSFWSVQIKWGFWKKPMRQTFNEAVYSMLHLLPPDEQKEAYDTFVYESGRAAYEIGYWLLDSKKASKVDESHVTCPVLVIAGAEDRITPASVVRQVAKKYKAVSTYKEFENHAHWVVAEPGWQEIAEYVAGWLKQCSVL
ncbi:MAG: alpha/beta hydrolase [Deltaproteobacteria bacterium]|nr:alpha/beta hydrolase [Deltaproteobacteria bacterium]